MKKIIGLIPSRMASTRYPGKPLAEICGKTMIEHVWQRVKLNKKINAVYIATCDDEIKRVAENFGAEVIMTSTSHERGTDRIAEGCRKLISSDRDFDVAINVQGDEPLLNPRSLDLAIEPFLKGEAIACVNLIERIDTEDDINDYNNVKVVFDQNNIALYFSRLPIPNGLKKPHYKQLGVYAMSREAVLKYSQMRQTPLEIVESDDMLRFVENGMPVKVALTPYKTVSVDTPDDYKMVCKLMRQDETFKSYSK